LRILYEDYFSTLRSYLSLDLRHLRIMAYVLNFQFYKKYYRSSWVFNRILELHKKGTKIRIILDSSPSFSHNHRPNLFASKRFFEHGIPLRMQTITHPQHSKLFIFDDLAALTGSHNLTQNSLESYLEISVEIIEPEHVASLAAHFDQLWMSEKTQPWTRRIWPKSKPRT
jgi:phosphatidylserine/phosphatidylglycerophosphate/cardiolipin synthase-like enzyme